MPSVVGIYYVEDSDYGATTDRVPEPDGDYDYFAQTMHLVVARPAPSTQTSRRTVG